MATVTREFCSSDEGRLVASYAFDDTANPPKVISVSLTNDTGGRLQITVQFRDPESDQVVKEWTGAAHTGTQSRNVRNLNVFLVDRVARDGSHYWGLPYTAGCQVS